mgnify:CR=1 FL=1
MITEKSFISGVMKMQKSGSRMVHAAKQDYDLYREHSADRQRRKPDEELSEEEYLARRREEKLKKIKFLEDKDKIYLSIFFIFLIPGTPKDVISYAAGITSIKLIPFLLISTVARIPSIVSSTIGGSYLGTKNYKMAIIILVVTLIISLILFLIYKNHEKRRNYH